MKIGLPTREGAKALIKPGPLGCNNRKSQEENKLVPKYRNLQKKMETREGKGNATLFFNLKTF